MNEKESTTVTTCNTHRSVWVTFMGDTCPLCEAERVIKKLETAIEIAVSLRTMHGVDLDDTTIDLEKRYEDCKVVGEVEALTSLTAYRNKYPRGKE